MDRTCDRVSFVEIAEDVRRHLATLPSAIDSYLEEHILASHHCRIGVAGEMAGCASIHEGKLVTQFALDPPFRHLGQPRYANLRRLEEVRSAFVPTCDELYRSHALDDYRQLATPDDIALVQQESGDFFAPIERQVDRQELIVTARRDDDRPLARRVPPSRPAASCRLLVLHHASKRAPEKAGMYSATRLLKIAY